MVLPIARYTSVPQDVSFQPGVGSVQPHYVHSPTSSADYSDTPTSPTPRTEYSTRCPSPSSSGSYHSCNTSPDASDLREVERAYIPLDSPPRRTPGYSPPSYSALPNHSTPVPSPRLAPGNGYYEACSDARVEARKSFSIRPQRESGYDRVRGASRAGGRGYDLVVPLRSTVAQPGAVPSMNAGAVPNPPTDVEKQAQREDAQRKPSCCTSCMECCCTCETLMCCCACCGDALDCISTVLCLVVEVMFIAGDD